MVPLDVLSAAPVWLGCAAQLDAYANVDRVSLIPTTSPARRSGGDIHTLLPIFITLFAALFIGDRIGLMGWTSVLLGFAGVALILRPTPNGFKGYALLPLVSAVLYALAMILTRTKCREEHPLILALGVNFSFIAIGLFATLLIAMVGGSTDQEQGTSFLFGEWSAMGMVEWVTMALLAAGAIIGSIGAAIAYQSGSPAKVAIFDFTYVGFAALWGVLFFAEVLDHITLAGMAMIIGAGVLAMRR